MEICLATHSHRCVDSLCAETDAWTAQAASAEPISNPKGTDNPAPSGCKMSMLAVSHHISDVSCDIGDILESHISVRCHVSSVVQHTCS